MLNPILEKQIAGASLSQVYVFEGKYEDTKKQYEEFCRRILKSDKDIHSLIDLVIPEKNNIALSEIRQVNKKVYERPVGISKRIIVIEEAHFMRNEGQNAMLKTLEDLNDYVIVIFTTDNRYKLRDTILSRAQVVSLVKQNEEDKSADEVFTLLFDIADKRYYSIRKNRELVNKLAEDKKGSLSKLENIVKDLIFYMTCKNYAVCKFDTRYESKLKRLENLKKDRLEKLVFEIEKVNELLSVNINFQIAWERLMFILMEE